MFISWKHVNYAKFQKKFDIIEQFQGNYLNTSGGNGGDVITLIIHIVVIEDQYRHF